MKKSSRLLILLLAIGVGGYFLKPSVVWYFMYTENDRNEASLSGSRLKAEIETRIDNSVDSLKSSKNNSEEFVLVKKELEKKVSEYNSVRKENVKIAKNAEFKDLEAVLFKMYGYETKSDEEKNSLSEKFVKKALENYFTETFDAKKKVKQDIIKLGLDLQGGVYAVVTLNFDHPSVKGKFKGDQDKSDALDNAVKMIENRINKFGVSETTIQKIKNQNKIVINLPGVKEASDLRKIIETVGVLEFKVVSKEGSDILSSIKKQYDLEGKSIVAVSGSIIPEVLSQLPPDTEVLKVANKDKYGEDMSDTPYLVVKKESLLGDNPQVDTATVNPDNLGRNVINFTLKGDAVDKWAKATRDNIGNQIAIILDDVILQSPTVQSEIPNGSSQVSLGNLSYEELDDMAKILRSGSLNVPMEISEENTVGASLGKDTIEKGLMAMLLGFIFVVVFMFLYYNVGGLVSIFALVLNMFFLISGLDMFNGTLTLPGMAGVVLTLGMAVDANVIIYERVIEEYRNGKSFNTSMVLGYDKAFWTIMDSNITTFAAAIGISLFATGPVKGFAVTLCIGIISTLFTALFVTKLIWDSLVSKIEFKTIRPLTFVRKGKI